MNTRWFSFILILFSLYSCKNTKEEAKQIINRIENYKTTEGNYPASLDRINVHSNKFCYYLEYGNFNLEYTSFNDLYWYNSGNRVWDFLEGDAKNSRCAN